MRDNSDMYETYIGDNDGLEYVVRKRCDTNMHLRTDSNKYGSEYVFSDDIIIENAKYFCCSAPTLP